MYTLIKVFVLEAIALNSKKYYYYYYNKKKVCDRRKQKRKKTIVFVFLFFGCKIFVYRNDKQKIMF